jgi:hypothetical protein
MLEATPCWCATMVRQAAILSSEALGNAPGSGGTTNCRVAPRGLFSDARGDHLCARRDALRFPRVGQCGSAFAWPRRPARAGRPASESIHACVGLRRYQGIRRLANIIRRENAGRIQRPVMPGILGRTAGTRTASHRRDSATSGFGQSSERSEHATASRHAAKRLQNCRGQLASCSSTFRSWSSNRGNFRVLCHDECRGLQCRLCAFGSASV